MYLICYGTRPELIKLIPLINKFKEKNKKFLTLFSGQHQDLIKDFYNLVEKPNIILENVMERGQNLDSLVSKILLKMSFVFENNNIDDVIIQGDTSSSFAIALSSFHHKKNIIHVEAGLRTFNKYSPFPEEMNRVMISNLANIHLCPTSIALENLKKENIINNVYNVGNTIVDMFDFVSRNKTMNEKIKNLISEQNDYILVTLHRRENRGEKMENMWFQLNKLSEKYNIIYITHPSLPDAKKKLKVKLIDPVDYVSMVHLILNCKGMITDSGGLQEEAVCAGKKVLICRDTTERPETISSGYGKLVDTKIIDNFLFLFDNIDDKNENPYGENVCDKIINLL